MSKHKLSGLAGILCSLALLWLRTPSANAAGAPLTFTNSPTSGVTPLTVSFTAPATDTNGALTNFNWDFGDGATSTNQNPAHTYTNAGIYSPILTGNDVLGLSYYAIGQSVTNMAPPPVASETPGTVSSAYGGTVSLRVTNLQSGASVLVQKYIDLNSDGVVSPGDLLIGQYQVTDGVGAPVLNGVTNFNIPADWNPTNGDITILQDHGLGGIEHSVVGHYIYVISSPTAAFAPVTTTLTVTNAAYTQSFSGVVQCNGTNIANAIVWLVKPAVSSNSDVTFVGGTVADSGGNYSIAAPAGMYQLVPFAQNFVANMANSPALALAANATVTANLVLSNAIATIAGSIVDATNSGIKLPGVVMEVSGANGDVSFGSTDSNGDFSLSAMSGLYGVTPEPIALEIHDYVDLSSGATANTISGSVSGVTLALPRGTSLIYGRVTDTNGVPLPGVRMDGVNGIDGSGAYQAAAGTDTNGNYVIAVAPGNWSAQADARNPAYANYVFSTGPAWTYQNSGAGTNFAVNTTALADFAAAPATNQISGNVEGFDFDEVFFLSGIGVAATATIDGNIYFSSADTDSNGNYSLTVANASWQVNAKCGCTGGDCLGTNYFCPGQADIGIDSGDASGVDFVAPLIAAQISGTVAATNGTDIANVEVVADGAVGGNEYELTAETDGNGHYSFSVPAGDWVIGVNCQSGGDSLNALGYQCTTNDALVVSGGNYTANFYPQLEGGTPPFVYTAIPTNGTLPLSVQFGGPSVDYNANPIAGWYWDFGDNVQTNSQNPAHVYESPGIYYPFLRVTNNLSQSIDVGGPSIEVDGGSSPPSVESWTVPPPLAPGSSGTLGVYAIFGSPPFAFQWSLNGTNIPGATQSTYIVSNASSAVTGGYAVEITNAFGSQLFGPLNVTLENNSPATNLVVNGGFETGDFTGWTLSGDTNYASVVSADSGFGNAHSGMYFASFLTAGDFGYISQTLPTMPGSNYVVSFYVNTPPPDPDDLQVIWDGNTILSQTNIVTGGWVGWSKTITATSSNTTLTFAYLDTDIIMGLDDISVTPVPAAASCAPAPASLAYWWSAEDNALDSIGGNNGALQGGVNFTNGEVGRGFNFDGSTGYVSTSTHLSDPEDFSLGLWFKTTTTNGGALIGFCDAQTGDPEFFDRTIFMDTNGAMHFGIFYIDEVFTVDSLGGYNDGQWHYVAANSSAAGIELYLDGQLTGSDSYPTNAENIGGYWRIGDNGFASCCWPFYPPSDYFQGAIDEVSIYNSTLDSNQIAAVYNAGGAGTCGEPPTASCVPPPPGLVSWWPADGNALDATGGNNGSLSNVTFLPGEAGQSFNFTNVDSAVLIGNPASLQLQNFTIEGWVRRADPNIVTLDPSAFEGNALFFAYGVNGYGFGLFPGGNLDLTDINVDNITTGASITDTNWHHVAVTKSGGSVVFYVDGRAYPYDGTYSDTFQFTTPAAIGARGDTVAGGFTNGQINSFLGGIDELSIYNRALTSTEIASIYYASSLAKCGGGAVSGSVITFDDINDNGQGTQITNGYHGFNWSNFWCFNTPLYSETYPANGYINGTVTFSNVAYNFGGGPALVYSSTPFALNSGDFTAAWNNGMTLETVGMNGSTLAFSNNFVINATGPTLVSFPAVPVTQVMFLATGGASAGYDGSGTQLILDNLTFESTNTTIPPILAWPTPAPISYGTPVNSTQLNATASVPGTFAYSVSNGAILNAGVNILSAVFTPADTGIYSPETTNVLLTVTPGHITLTASNAIWLAGTPKPALTGSMTGTNFADGISFYLTNRTAATSPPGTYAIVPKLIDPNHRLGNYIITTNIGILTYSRGVVLTSPANGASYGTNAAIPVAATASVPGGAQTLAIYVNGSLVTSSNSVNAVSGSVSNLAPGGYQFTAVATGASNQTFSQTVYVTVNAPGTSLINFDPLDTTLGVMNGSPLATYLGGYGVALTNVTFGAAMEAATGAEAGNQNPAVTNAQPVPSSSPNLFTEVGSTKPVSFTLAFAPQQSFGFTRVGITNTGTTPVSHPAWSAHILDASGNELESVSESLLLTTNSIPPRVFTLVGNNIASVRFDSDSRNGSAAFSAVLLDDLFLSANPANDPIFVTMAQPSGGTAPLNVTLSATAADQRTNIDHVSFYSGPALIGTVSNAPYNFTWSNVLNGAYILTAQVVDAAGYAKSSAPVTNTVQIGGSAAVVNFDLLNASGGPLTNSSLFDYLAEFDGTQIATNSPGSAVAVENQANVAGGGFVVASSLPNIVTQIGSNGPVSFTISFTNLLSQFSFTRPELLANPSVSHPAWQVQAFDPVGNPLGFVASAKISSSTNVPPRTYTVTNPAGGGGIASVQFNSAGNGLATFNAMIMDDFVLTQGSNLPPSVLITSPTNGQIFTGVSGIPLNVQAVAGSGAVSNVAYYFNGVPITNATAPFSATWTAPGNGVYSLVAVASNTPGLSATSAPVSITITPGALAIVSGPTNETIGIGGNANFSVTATGTNYQWQFNGAAVAGATSSTFSVNNAQTGAGGLYTVVVSGGGQSITSQPPALLTVLPPPSIDSISPGTNVSATFGTNMTLTVSASETAGLPFYYQWQRNGQFIDGATNSAYTISNAQPSDSGQYQVMVANQFASQESPVFVVSVSFPGVETPAMTNDVFASSMAIDPTNGPAAGDNSGSPASGELSTIAGKPAGKFLWYNWTAGFTGVMTLSTLGSSFDTLMGIYTGRDPSSLTTLAEDDDSAGYFASQCSFNCVQGTTYQIAVAGFKGASGDVVLSCAGFVLIDTNYVDLTEPVILESPQSAIVSVGDTLALSASVTNAAIYQWYYDDAPIPGATGTQLVINNFPASASGNYYLEAANDVGSAQSDAAHIQVQDTAQTQGSPNTLVDDKFGDAVDLAAVNSQDHYRPKDAGGETGGFVLSQSFSTIGATKEQNEPNHAGQPGGASYWYSYTAPAGGPIQFNTAGSSFNTILAIYTGPGNSFATLTNVGAAFTTNYLTQGQPVVTVTNGVAGTKYYIAVDGYQGASGSARLGIVQTALSNTVASGGVIETNSAVVLTMAAPANNYYTTSSNLTVHGVVRGVLGAQSPLLSFVQLSVNGSAAGHTVLTATNFSALRSVEPGGAVGIVPQETIAWSTNITLVPGANVLTAQSISAQAANFETASRPVTHTVFLVTSLPASTVKSTITLLVSPAGHGHITGVANHATLEVNKVYRVRAESAGNYIFTNWTSGTGTNALAPLFGEPSLSFIMTSNLILQANFVTNPFTAAAGTYNGLFSSSNGVDAASAGFFTATVPTASRGSFSGKVLLDGSAYPFTGVFNLSGDAQHTFVPGQQPPIAMALHLDLTAPDGLMTGSLSSVATNGWNSTLLARAAFNLKGNPATNYAGKYTVAIAPGGGAPTNAPGGYSYGVINASRSGRLVIAGRMADNTPISQSVAISTDGNVPLYVSLYSRKGLLMGWLNVTNQNVLGTNLAWIKMAGHSKYYAAGFTNTDLAAFGSFYTNNFVLTNATLTLSNGSGGMTVSNILLAHNRLSSADSQASGSVDPGTGYLTLTIKPGGVGPAVTAKGVVLETQGGANAAGWFLGTDQSGYFLLQQ